MPIKWVESLVHEIAERRCIIFLGAGASQSAAAEDGSAPPDWRALLKGLAGAVTDSKDKEIAQRLIDQNHLLDAAEVLVGALGAADFSQQLNLHLPQSKFEPSDLHRAVIALDPKIVVTTNFDQIYESCWSGSPDLAFQSYTYDANGILDSIRSKTRILLKAHGCVSNPSKAVLSRSQYFSAKLNHPGFYSIMDALFLTHTVLFIGCSLEDHDIRLVLEGSTQAAPATHPHYALWEDNKHPSIKKTIEESYNIQLLQYPEGQHHEVVRYLQDLATAVNEFRSTH